jgi:Xaa-Pro aminopeptidase
VHDVGDYNRPFEAGMAFVIEPGLYIRPQALDDLPKTPENKAFAERVGPAAAKYANIGIRIEDSFLLTDTGWSGCRRRSLAPCRRSRRS